MTDYTTTDSTAHVPTDRLTDWELRNVVDACEWLRVGYDSSYSNDAVTTKVIEDPRYDPGYDHTGHFNPTVGGRIRGDDGYVGFSGQTVKTASSSGRIGTLEYVEYPAIEPKKTRWDVTLRALAGRLGSPTFDGVEDRMKQVVDRRSYDDIEAPPEPARRQEEVDIGEDRTTIKVAVDIPRTLVVCDMDTAKVEDVIERARQTVADPVRHGDAQTAMYRDNVPDIGDHTVEFDGAMGNTKSKNLRKSVFYWITDVPKAVGTDINQ